MAHIHHWETIHDHTTEADAARMVLATTDGDFRVTALHVGGQVRLVVEKPRLKVAGIPAIGPSAQEAMPR